MIEGYLDQVKPYQIAGWTFDRDNPNSHLVVDIFCGERHLGSTVAELYRVDLAASSVGDGDHGFVFQCPEVLGESELAGVTARVRNGSNSTEAQQLPIWKRRAPTVGDSEIVAMDLGSVSCDDTQFPVFILGAPRSGTSAVAQALRAATVYRGHQEGQVIDLLTPLLRTLRRFYEFKADEITHPERITMIKEVPLAYFGAGISALFTTAVKKLFPDRHWIDKTPTADMIFAAPHILRIWPNAKFIFLKRRALENILSRLRKFGPGNFEAQCLEWTNCMEAWKTVQGSLAGRALEVDQHLLARDPERVGRAIGALLGVATDDVEKLEVVLRRNQPERTSTDLLAVCDAATIDWDPERWEVFERVCAATMASYGYSLDRNYYLPDRPDRSCCAL
jgi:hypothetical protein